MNTRPCTRCKGSQVLLYGPTIPSRECFYCKEWQQGMFPEPNVAAIVTDIKSSRGVLRRTRPDRAKGPRSYYVWRMARFHGGQDVTLPVTASMAIGGDPWQDELDVIAEAVAKLVYGTDMAASHRWVNALGRSTKVPDGLPPTAYPGGPVKIGSR